MEVDGEVYKANGETEGLRGNRDTYIGVNPGTARTHDDGVRAMCLQRKKKLEHVAEGPFTAEELLHVGRETRQLCGAVTGASSRSRIDRF